MTPEQVTRRKSWMYASISGAIAMLVVAYQYATETPREGVTSPYVPIGFAVLGLVFFIGAAIVARQVKKDGTPAATTDLGAPGGTAVKILLAVGIAAMAGTWLVGYVTPEKEPLGLTLSTVSLLIALVCLIAAGRIAKRIRDAAATQITKE
jgi:hypothetical protein